MRVHPSVLVLTVLVLSLTFSGLATQTPPAVGAGGQHFLAPSDGAVRLAPPDTAKRKHRAGLDLGRGRSGLWTERCQAPGLVRLLGAETCTHGTDPAPPGVSMARSADPLPVRTASQQAASVACAGDGESGFRVQVLYVRASDVASRFIRYRPSIQAWAAEADQVFQHSAAATGGSRALRFVHDSTCLPLVQEVVLSPAGDGGFGTMITELENLGFNRTDRIYLAFVDTRSAGICGIGTLWDDDRASEAKNWNNSGPSWSRVDAPCWSGRVAAHELMHNLGGVQHSAPNASRGFHCVDEYDVMCYSDDPHYPAMRTECPNQPVDETRFDCNHDDYFHTNPGSGTYLAKFWNPANNRFLISAAAPPASDTVPPVVGRVAMPGRPKAGHRIKLAATASDNVEVRSVAFGVCEGTRCSWAKARTLKTDARAPYTATWKAPKQGTFTFLARATDGNGNVTVSAPKKVTVKKKR